MLDFIILVHSRKILHNWDFYPASIFASILVRKCSFYNKINLSLQPLKCRSVRLFPLKLTPSQDLAMQPSEVTWGAAAVKTFQPILCFDFWMPLTKFKFKEFEQKNLVQHQLALSSLSLCHPSSLLFIPHRSQVLTQPLLGRVIADQFFCTAFTNIIPTLPCCSYWF